MSKVGEQVKVLAVEPDGSGWLPGTHVKTEGKLTDRAVLRPSHNTPEAYTDIRTHGDRFSSQVQWQVPITPLLGQ